jgi:hypothetical protein
MKEQQEMHRQFYEAYPSVITLEDAMRQALAMKKDRDRWMQCAEMLVESQDEALKRYHELQRQASEAVRDGK